MALSTDKNAAIDLAHNPKIKDATKHIDIVSRLARERIADGSLVYQQYRCSLWFTITSLWVWDKSAILGSCSFEGKYLYDLNKHLWRSIFVFRYLITGIYIRGNFIVEV